MKKLLVAVLLAVFLVVPAFAQDNLEMLTLKRDLIQERVMRVQAELNLMRSQFAAGQEALKDLNKELEAANSAVKAAAPAKPVK